MDEQDPTIELKHVTDPIPPFGAKQTICPICGKTFYIPDKTTYVYKRQVYVKGKKHKTVFLHTWTCVLRLEERVKNKDLSFLEGLKQ